MLSMALDFKIDVPCVVQRSLLWSQLESWEVAGERELDTFVF